MALKLVRNVMLSVVSAIALVAIVLATMAHSVLIVAEEQINLYDKPINGKFVGKLNTGEVISVVRCEDSKHYILPVVLVDGEERYVMEGKYSLHRKKAWEANAGPLSFSCP